MDIRDEAISTGKYVLIGLALSVFINQGLGYALNTEKPIMAVVSNSMVPEFYRGDLIVVKGLQPEEIAVGDIIVYKNPYKGIPIVHRVIGIESDTNGNIYFLTKGDNNSHTDQESGISPPVYEKWVMGEVKVIVPKLGYFKVALIEAGGYLGVY